MSSLREELLAGIRSHREQFEAAGDRAEELRTLPHDAVATLRALGLFWLKTPAELGGTPLSPVEFCDVIEELAYIDTSTAWAAMIGAGCNGLAGGWLPEAGARRIFGSAAGTAAGGRPLPVLAGQLAPRGTGAPTASGYLVHGRWGFSSGIVHADWLIGAFKADGVADRAASGAGADADGGAAGTGFGRIVVFAIPKAEAEVIDNWHVAGLQGTGSLDFSLDGTFVPAELTYELGSPAVRGGDLFRLGMPAFVSNEVPPLCIGLARRAIDDITELAAHTARFPGGPTVSERAVFHHELGRAEVRVRAARAVHREAMAAAFASAAAGRRTVGRAAARDHHGLGLRRRDLRRRGQRPVQVRRRPCPGAVQPHAASPAQRARRPAARRPVRGELRGGRPLPPRIRQGPPPLTADLGPGAETRKTSGRQAT